MACSIVALIVPFPGLAGLAICKEALIRGGVNRHPDFTHFSMHTIGMSGEDAVSAISSNEQMIHLSIKRLIQ